MSFNYEKQRGENWTPRARAAHFEAWIIWVKGRGREFLSSSR